ncbi:MAG: phospholipase D-like domain-containing protein, partial [bacterium]
KLETADHSVYFNMFTFTNDRISKKLTELKNRGIKIRGTVEVFQTGSTYSRFSNLRENKVPVRKDNFDGVLHDKYAVIDGGSPNSNPTVVTGSFNWTFSANYSNDENLISLQDATIASHYYKDARDIFR